MLEGAGSTAGATLDPAQLMQDLAASDPRMAMLIQLMQAQRRQPADDIDAPNERDETILELRARLDAAEAQLARMTHIARQLRDAGRIASGRLGRLAAALGSCGMCWGEDPGCRGCRGRGRPGMVRPDPEMRAQLFGAQSPVREASRQPH